MQKGILGIFFLLAAIFAGCSSKAPAPPPAQEQGYADAIDLKQKFTDLADQLLSGIPAGSLKGYVAAPSVFVNEDNFGQVYPLGRLAAESVEYELGQRGIAAREYHPATGMTPTGSVNAMAIAASRKAASGGRKPAAVLVGTYQVSRDATFVNARLVRPANGEVLSTADLILPNTPLVLSLARGNGMYGTTQGASAYVAPQSAPVLAPTYPTLGGSVIQSGTAGIPIIQAR